MSEVLSPQRSLSLRPLTTAELADRIFSVYRQNFSQLFLLSLISQIPLLLIDMVAHYINLETNAFVPPENLTDGLYKVGMRVLLSLPTWIINSIFQYSLVAMISALYLGYRFDLKTLLGVAIRRWKAILATLLVQLGLLFPTLILLGGVIGAVFVLITHTAAYLNYSLWIFFGAPVALVLALAPFLWVTIRLMVVMQTLVLEGLSGWAAIRRSFQIVGFNPGRGFWYWGETRLSLLLLPILVVQMVLYILTAAPLLVFGAWEYAQQGNLGALANPTSFFIVASQILVYLNVALMTPLLLAATTLFYYEVRIRREGFDLNYMAEHAA